MKDPAQESKAEQGEYSSSKSNTPGWRYFPYCLLLLAAAKLDISSTSRKYIVVLACN